jgi:hypothetical protein
MTAADVPVTFTASSPRSKSVLSLTSPPMTYGRRGSPYSKATSTSSVTSGMNTAPPTLPEPNWTTRAQFVSYDGESHGSDTLTLPLVSGSLTLVTTPHTRPGMVTGGPCVPPSEERPSSERSCRPLT